MKQALCFFAVLLFCTSMGAQTVPVAGTIRDGSGNAIAGSFVKFQLANCGANTPEVASVVYTASGSVTSGTFTAGEIVIQASTAASAQLINRVTGANAIEITAPQGTADSAHTWVGQQSAAVYTPTGAPAALSASSMVGTTVIMHANSSGVVSGAIAANDVVSCGGIFDTTRWYVTLMQNTVTALQVAQRYHITLAGGTFNFNTAQVDTSTPPQPAWTSIFGNPVKSQIWTQPPGTRADLWGSFYLNGSLLGTGGSGGGGAPNQSVYFYFATSATLAVATPTVNIVWNCWDNGSPAHAIAIDDTYIDSSFNVTFTFPYPQSGYCVVNSSSGGGSGGGINGNGASGQITAWSDTTVIRGFPKFTYNDALANSAPVFPAVIVGDGSDTPFTGGLCVKTTVGSQCLVGQAGSVAGDIKIPSVATSAGPILAVTASSPLALDATTGNLSLPARYTALRCETGLGDGLNAITAGTYLQFMCVNDSGVTWTITGIHCWTDNAGASTLNAANNAATGLLTGAVTCNNTKASGGAAGAQSATVTLASGDAISFTFVADGTSKQSTWTVSLTQ